VIPWLVFWQLVGLRLREDFRKILVLLWHNFFETSLALCLPSFFSNLL
jgi:hypothetical protein